MPELVIIRGLPGSGKSTTAKTEFSSYKHFEADDYFVDLYGVYNFMSSELHKAHNWCYNQVRTQLLSGHNVVVSNTFTTIKEMKRYYELKHIVNNLVINIWECTGNYESVHNVPIETILKMKRRWQHIPLNWNVNLIESNI